MTADLIGIRQNLLTCWNRAVLLPYRSDFARNGQDCVSAGMLGAYLKSAWLKKPVYD